MSEQRRRGRRQNRGERQFGGPQAPGRQRRPGPKAGGRPAPKAYGDKLPGTGRGLDPESLREKIEWERWKNERRKKSDKPVTPLGKKRKNGPKPGSFDYFLAVFADCFKALSVTEPFPGLLVPLFLALFI